MRLYKKYLFILCLLCSCANTFASPSVLSKTLTVTLNNTSLGNALTIISKEAGVVFSYNPQQVNILQTVSADIRNSSLESALKQILPANISYKVNGRYVILLAQTTKKINTGLVTENTPSKQTQIEIKKEENNSNAVINRSYSPPMQKIAPLNSGTVDVTCHSSIKSNNNSTTTMTRKQMAALLLTAAVTVSAPALAAKNEPVEEKITVKEAVKDWTIDLLLASTEKTSIPALTSEEEEAPDQTKKAVAQVGFVYPIGSHGAESKNYTYNFSVNFLGGVSGGIKGFEGSGLYNINKGKATGLQMAGLLNMNKSSKHAVQAAGLVNTSGKGFAAYQAAGLVNTFGKGTAMVQTAGIANVLNEGKSVAQAAGIANLGDTTMVQMAGIVNKATDADAQFAGVVNISEESKFQMSGLVNITKRGGVQLGIVNIRDTADGVPIGLINLVKKGGLFEIGVNGGDFVNASVSLRTGIDKFYGILTYGCGFNDDFFWTWGTGIGTTRKINDRWGLNFEGEYFTLATKKHSTSKFNGLAQARPVVYFQLSKNFKIFAGPTFNLLVTNTADNNNLEVSAPYTIWDKTGDSKRIEAWIGGTIGFRF